LGAGVVVAGAELVGAWYGWGSASGPVYVDVPLCDKNQKADPPITIAATTNNAMIYGVRMNAI
jgi:hypothetical protein